MRVRPCALEPRTRARPPEPRMRVRLAAEDERMSAPLEPRTRTPPRASGREDEGEAGRMETREGVRPRTP
jgi:hypothetical protein